MLNQVRSAILEGHPLSDALQHFPTLFDSLYRTLVKAGEKSGLLAPVLEKLLITMKTGRKSAASSFSH